MDIHSIKTLAQPEMDKVNALIVEHLKSDVALVNQLGYYIVESGGKRLRPMLVALLSQALGCQSPHTPALATTVEFIHTATLLHDDVVDESMLRRGKDTANAVFGNQASVLVGDYLYSRAFQLMVGMGNMRIMQIMADATNTIAEGEVLQLMNCNDADISLERYYQVIDCKTAKLFQAAMESMAVLAECDENQISRLADYGRHLGIAFQLIDDALDYTQTAEEMGKNVGDDLAEGKPTLPVLHVLKVGNEEEKALVKNAIEQADLSLLPQVLTALENNSAIAHTLAEADKHVEIALACLEDLADSDFKAALEGIAHYTVTRTL